MFILCLLFLCHPHCPPERAEYSYTYESYVYTTLDDGTIIKGDATSTPTGIIVSFHNAKTFALGTTTFGYRVKDKKLIPGAKEYNERVHECQTANGEF